MRRRAVETRFDFRGGVNQELAPELLTPNELVSAKNCRISERGTIEKRTGSVALFDETTYGTIRGKPWWHPDEQRLYFVAGASAADPDLMTWNSATGLVQLDAGMGDTWGANAWQLSPYLGTNVVFIAAIVGLGYFNGGVMNTVTRPSGATEAHFLETYQGRLWTGDSEYIEWSAPSDGSDFALASGGGYAKVDFGDGGPLYGIAAIGGSLLLLRKNQINRLTLTGAENIDIARDSEGLASDIGVRGKFSYCIAENLVYFASEDALYVASESEVVPISQKLDSVFRGLVESEVPYLEHNQDRHEIIVVFSVEDVSYTFNYRTGSWTGPHDSWFTVPTYMAPYGKGALAGVKAARIYDMDSGYLDFSLAGGTPGQRYETEIEFPPFLFRDPRQIKTIRGASTLEADLGDDTHVTLSWSSEMGSGSIELHSKGEGVHSYPFRLRARGRRISIVVTEDLEYAVEIFGLVLEAVKGRRGG